MNRLEFSSASPRVLAWLHKGALAITDQALVSGSNFVAFVLLARWMPPQEYGAYALAYSVLLFTSSFHNAFLLEPLGVFGPSGYRDSLPEYLGSLIRIHVFLCLPIALMIAAIGFCLRLANTTGNADLSSALFGAAVAIPAVLFAWLLRRAAYVQLKPKLALLGSSAYAFVMLALLFRVHQLRELTIFSVFVVQAIASLVACGLLAWRTRPQLLKETSVVMREVACKHWRYGRWVGATAVGYWLSNGAFYLLVAMVLSMNKVADLKALQNVCLVPNQIIVAMSLLLLPSSSVIYADHGLASLKRNVMNMVAIYSIPAVLYLGALLIFGNRLIHLLYHGAYSEVAYLLPLAAIPVLFMAASEPPAIALRVLQVPFDIFVGYTVSGVVSLPIGFLMTRHWGLAGALGGLVLASFLYFIVVATRYRSRTRKLSPRESGTEDIRVALIAPSHRRGYYHQPIIRELAKVFPQTKLFVGEWPGFSPGCEGLFPVRIFPEARNIVLRREGIGYPRTVAWAPLSLFWELLKFRPRIIFTNQFGTWTMYALLVKWLTGTRVVLLWEGISPGVSYLHSKVRLSLRRFLARFFDGCVTNTHEAADYLRDTIRMPESKIRQSFIQVPEPAALNHEAPVAVALDQFARPVFLYVGSLSLRKGVRFLIEAAAHLKRHQGKFSVVLVGEGDPQWLHELSQELGVEESIHIVGEVPYENLGWYFRACDVFVLPTLEDTWGMVIVEAMAFGKPVLCSCYAGAKEMVQHGKNGFLFDPLEAEQLPGFMARYIHRPALVAEYGAASASIMEHYTPKRSARVLADVAFDVIR